MQIAVDEYHLHSNSHHPQIAEIADIQIFYLNLKLTLNRYNTATRITLSMAASFIARVCSSNSNKTNGDWQEDD